jgi:LysR family transcriptional regulator, glycine cleavage system transcriptional activator
MNGLPSLRSLEVFEAVGRYGGITEAARRLGITAGAVSQQMKLLEESLGLSLTLKVGNRIHLTAAGQRYHKGCVAAFESLRIAHTEVERTRNPTNMRISAMPSLLSQWLAPRVFAWQDQHPDLDVFLEGAYEEPSPEGYEVDFRFTYSDREHLGNVVELFHDYVVPVCSPALLRQHGPLQAPADLLAYPLLSVDWLPKYVSPPSWRDWFASQNVDCSTLRDGYRVFSLSYMAVQAAVRGQGIALAQCSMITDELAAGSLMIPFHNALVMPTAYYLVSSRSAYSKPHCRDFHRWLVAQGREQTAATERLLGMQA